ncbi:MAG: type II toxin-antitoxin system HicB family antitoxin, partial [Planctomycetota bacterium]|nr:type II toxin-antitoxin system HicB family antitoxin [Planctomycetota bacterium]
LVLKASRDGGYVVSCPFDPELITQGETLDEALAMARDAQKTLAEARAKKAAPRRRPVPVGV